MKILFVTLTVMLFSFPRSQAQIREAQQLVVAIADDWNARSGKIHLFDRTSSGWKKQRMVFDVSFGKNGLAWGKGVHPEQKGAMIKKEGDGRSPAGVFDIETLVYGIDSAAPEGIRIPYRPMTEWTRCIDDPASGWYNTILEEDPAKPQSKDWSSAERMKAVVPDYRYVLVVRHNPERIPGGGSCIFLHVNNVPTVGCTSMEESDMVRLLRWLDPEKRTMVVQLPHPEYHRLRTAWELPALTNK